MRKFEACALVALLVAGEQSSVDTNCFSAPLTSENLPAAGDRKRKHHACFSSAFLPSRCMYMCRIVMYICHVYMCHVYMCV